MGYKAYVSAIRTALLACTDILPHQARLYSGHSLRVGGSIQMRRWGIPDDIHRMLGGWASLQSASNYQSLSSAEQLALSNVMALQQRKVVMSASQADKAIHMLQSIRIG